MTKRDLIPSRGAVAEPLLIEVTRQLQASDLGQMADAPKVAVPILQKLRAIHHRQALLLAEGRTQKEVSQIIGCTEARLTQLMVDPTFVDLVETYKAQIITSMLSDAGRMQDKLTDMGEMAVDEIIERLEDTDQRKRMRTEELRRIAETALDRSIAPVKQALPTATTPANVTINFGTPIRVDREVADAEIIEG